MTRPNFDATIGHFAARLSADHESLARTWLERLDELLQVDRTAVFPSLQLLDHIPDLLREIATYLRAPYDQEIAANTAVMSKAAELGLLRFDQRASVHQILREYQFLAEILDAFFARESATLGERADSTAALLAAGRAQRAVRELQRKTVDAFVTRYGETIDEQHGQLRSFGRLVSHEMRQPLGVLQVLTRLLQDERTDRQRLVSALGRNVDRLGELLGKLERLTRLADQPDGAPNDQVVDLGAIARDVAGQLNEMAAARDVQVDVAEALPRLHADAGRVELVLVNLIANAVKYSDPLKPSRFVRVRPESDPTRLLVQDNGIGIPRHLLGAIFDQFVRVHPHLDDDHGSQGIGLGLAIVRESMQAMGGAVEVESVEGEGTVFRLTWPPSAWDAARDAEATTPADRRSSPPSGNRSPRR